MTELADILWRDIAEANLEHDAPHERRLCDELHGLVPEQPATQPRDGHSLAG